MNEVFPQIPNKMILKVLELPSCPVIVKFLLNNFKSPSSKLAITQLSTKSLQLLTASIAPPTKWIAISLDKQQSCILEID